MTKLGFSLLELLFVIAIAALVFFILPFIFMAKFKSKAYLEKDTIVYARGCMGDIITYCINHPFAPLSPSISPNCQNRTGIYGNITVEMDQANCNGSQPPEGFTVKFYNTASIYYYINCTYKSGNVFCEIKPK